MSRRCRFRRRPRRWDHPDDDHANGCGRCESDHMPELFLLSESTVVIVSRSGVTVLPVVVDPGSTED